MVDVGCRITEMGNLGKIKVFADLFFFSDVRMDTGRAGPAFVLGDAGCWRQQQ